MPRAFVINGESLVQVLGPAGSLLSGIVQLGLAEDAIQVSMTSITEACVVDAYGKQNPVDEQVFGGWAEIEMNLVHFNPVILGECIRLAWPGALSEGAIGRAGQRRGQALPLGSTGNSLITLNIASPVAGLPYNFGAAFLSDRPYVWPLGTKRSIVRCRWKAIPYSQDPYNSGLGSTNVSIYSRTAIAIGTNP